VNHDTTYCPRSTDEDRVKALSLNRLPHVRAIVERGEQLSPAAAAWLLAQFDVQAGESEKLWRDCQRLGAQVEILRTASADAIAWVNECGEFLVAKATQQAGLIAGAVEGRAA